MIVDMISRRFRLNISVYHTNRRPIKNTIGVVMNRLVVKALKPFLTWSSQNRVRFE